MPVTSGTPDMIRGAALGPFIDWYARVHGRAGLERALARLSEQDRRRFDPAAPGLGISLARWYASATIHRMLDGLLDGLDAHGRSALASAGADETLASSLTGYLGVAFRSLVSPRMCAMLGPTLWHTYYSGGRVRIDPQGRRCHIMEVSGWSGHHAFLCELNNAAGRAIYRAAGGDHVTTEHAACVARGDPTCVYVIRW